MDCADFQAIVAGERDEDLSSAEALAFERHLEGCSVCTDAVAMAESDLDRLASALEPPAIPANAWASVDAAVAAATRKPLAPVSAPRGEVTPLHLPIGAPVAVVAAESPALAQVPAQPGLVRQFFARRGNGRSSGLGLAAAVAVGAVALSFVSLSGSRPPVAAGIGRVTPPEEGDVVIVELKPGKDYQERNGGDTKFIFITPTGK